MSSEKKRTQAEQYVRASFRQHVVCNLLLFRHQRRLLTALVPLWHVSAAVTQYFTVYWVTKNIIVKIVVIINYVLRKTT